jgi:hypothetical protein
MNALYRGVPAKAYKMWPAVLVLAAVGWLATVTVAEQAATSATPLEQKLVSLRRGAMEAWQKKDAETLKATMATDFLFIGPHGVSSREGWLGSLQYCSLESYSMEDVQFRQLSAEAAMLIYKLNYKGECGGQPIPGKTVTTDVFALRDGKWWIVNTTFTPVMN